MTYSILGRDTANSDLGVAVQSKFPDEIADMALAEALFLQNYAAAVASTSLLRNRPGGQTTRPHPGQVNTPDRCRAVPLTPRG